MVRQARRTGLILLATATLSTTGAARVYAHKPIFSDGMADTIDAAIPIDDVTISYVVYHEVTSDSQQLWLAFDGQAGQQVFFSLGVPVIDRLEDYRPVLAVIGPGLPAAELPFAIPQAFGAVTLALPEGQEPEFFHEEFTGTDSWILGDLEIDLPQDGQYYAVAYVPDGRPGKLWVAPGKREVFGLGDIISLPQVIRQVRDFHEIATPNVPCFLPFLAGGFMLMLGARFVRRRRQSPGVNGHTRTSKPTES